MKRREYIKPVVIVEDFLLSQSVAACGEKLVTSTDLDCLPEDVKAITSDFGYFVEETNCSDTNVDFLSPMFDGYCYHTSADANTLFNS